MLPEGAAPYVFPLRIDATDRADHIYAVLRRHAMPVFRWDRIWPGTPTALPGDVGPLWSRNVLQLLCHQDLSEADVMRTAQTVLGLLAARVNSSLDGPEAGC